MVTNVQIDQFMFSFICGVATLGLHFYVYGKSCILVQPRFQGQLIVPLPQLPYQANTERKGLRVKGGCNGLQWALCNKRD